MIKITVNCENANKIAELIVNKKNAISAYEKARNNTMMAIKEFLFQTKQSFTAKELSNKFGLPVNIIARNAPEYGIWRRDRKITKRYAHLTEDGRVDLDDIREFSFTRKEYFMK